MREQPDKSESDVLTQLDTETDFLLFEPGERTTTREQRGMIIAEMLEIGFVFEGFHSYTLVFDGHFVDEYTMAILLN